MKEGRETTKRQSHRPAGAPPSRVPVVGPGLDEAVRKISEGILAAWGKTTSHQVAETATAAAVLTAAVQRGIHEAAQADALVQAVRAKVIGPDNETAELDRRLARLDAAIADEKKEMSALLARLRTTRIAA